MVDPNIEINFNMDPRSLAELSASQAMQDCDLNDDGRLDYAEFGAWFLNGGSSGSENSGGRELGTVIAEPTILWEQEESVPTDDFDGVRAPRMPASPAQLVAEGIHTARGGMAKIPQIKVAPPTHVGVRMGREGETSSESDWRAVLDSPSFNAKLQELLQAESLDQMQSRTGGPVFDAEMHQRGGNEITKRKKTEGGRTTQRNKYGHNGHRRDSPAATRSRHQIQLFQQELKKQARLARYYYYQLTRVRKAFTAKSAALVAAQEEISELKSVARQAMMIDQFDETCKKMAHHALEVAQKERVRSEKALTVVTLLQRDNEALTEQVKRLTSENATLRNQAAMKTAEKDETVVSELVEEELQHAVQRGR